MEVDIVEFKQIKGGKRKSGNKCVVKTCNRCKRRDPTVRLFRNPIKDKTMSAIWMTQCKVTHNPPRIMVCDRHFEKKYFSLKKLKQFAIPTLNLEDDEDGLQNYNTSFKSCEVVVDDYETVLVKSEEEVRDNSSNDDLNEIEIGEERILKTEDNIMSEPMIETTFIATNSDILENDPIKLESTVLTTSEAEDNFKLSENLIDSETLQIRKVPSKSPPCKICAKKNGNNLDTITIDKSEYEKMKLELKDKNRQCQRQREQIVLYQKKLKNKTISSIIDKLPDISTSSKNILQMLAKKKKTSQRSWTDEEKNTAQKMYEDSPETYKYLKKRFTFNLPKLSEVTSWVESNWAIEVLNNINNKAKLKSNEESSDTTKNQEK